MKTTVVSPFIRRLRLMKLIAQRSRRTRRSRSKRNISFNSTLSVCDSSSLSVDVLDSSSKSLDFLSHQSENEHHLDFDEPGCGVRKDILDESFSLLSTSLPDELFLPKANPVDKNDVVVEPNPTILLSIPPESNEKDASVEGLNEPESIVENALCQSTPWSSEDIVEIVEKQSRMEDVPECNEPDTLNSTVSVTKEEIKRNKNDEVVMDQNEEVSDAEDDGGNEKQSIRDAFVAESTTVTVTDADENLDSVPLVNQFF